MEHSYKQQGGYEFIEHLQREYVRLKNLLISSLPHEQERIKERMKTLRRLLAQFGAFPFDFTKFSSAGGASSFRGQQQDFDVEEGWGGEGGVGFGERGGGVDVGVGDDLDDIGLGEVSSPEEEYMKDLFSGVPPMPPRTERPSQEPTQPTQPTDEDMEDDGRASQAPTEVEMEDIPPTPTQSYSRQDFTPLIQRMEQMRKHIDERDLKTKGQLEELQRAMMSLQVQEPTQPYDDSGMRQEVATLREQLSRLDTQPATQPYDDREMRQEIATLRQHLTRLDERQQQGGGGGMGERMLGGRIDALVQEVGEFREQINPEQLQELRNRLIAIEQADLQAREDGGQGGYDDRQIRQEMARMEQLLQGVEQGQSNEELKRQLVATYRSMIRRLSHLEMQGREHGTQSTESTQRMDEMSQRFETEKQQMKREIHELKQQLQMRRMPPPPQAPFIPQAPPPPVVSPEPVIPDAPMPEVYHTPPASPAPTEVALIDLSDYDTQIRKPKPKAKSRAKRRKLDPSAETLTQQPSSALELGDIEPTLTQQPSTLELGDIDTIMTDETTQPTQQREEIPSSSREPPRFTPMTMRPEVQVRADGRQRQDEDARQRMGGGGEGGRRAREVRQVGKHLKDGKK